MADKKISDFATLTDVQSNDLLLVSSVNETYNAKVETLMDSIKGDGVVLFDQAQSLTNAQKAQARENINAADAAVVDSIVGENIETETITVDKATLTKLSAYIGPSTHGIVTEDNTNLVYFECSPNMEYSVNKVLSARFRVGYTTTLPVNNVIVQGYVANNDATSLTLTTGSDARYAVIYYYDGKNDTLSESEIYDSIEITYEEEITETTAIDKLARSDLNTKVAINQGVAQAGKALVVGQDGNVTTGEAGVPEAVKVSLLDIFRHVAYADDQGDVYYNALAEALGVTPVVPGIYATLNLGTHDVYPTDNINSLRNYLTVIDDEGADIDDYEIDGSISSVGTNTIVVRRGTDTADVEVPVKANTRGLLYEWNLTDSLTDLRQLITATLHTGEGWEIPGKSEGTTPPIQGSTGVVFNDAQQLVRFLPSDMETTQFLKNKTVQVDVAEFNFTYGIGNTTEIRFIAFLSENSDNYRVAETGIFYGNSNKVDSGVTGWGLRHIKSAATTGYNSNAVSGQPSDISGHTVSLYFDDSLRGTMYIDGTLKKAYTESLADPTVYHTYGFQIGAGGRPAYGGCFYNARITGVRIYDGNAAQ